MTSGGLFTSSALKAAAIPRLRQAAVRHAALPDLPSRASSSSPMVLRAGSRGLGVQRNNPTAQGIKEKLPPQILLAQKQ